jgi:hypothetical protein
MLLSTVPVNVNISKMRGNQAEGSIAVDPLSPSKLFAVSNIDLGDGLMVATSTNGGATWSSRVIANDSDGLPPACCDCSTAFDSFGNLFLAYLNSTDNVVEVLLSTDAGQSFTLQAQFKGNVDQPTIVTGPGSVWLDYDRPPAGVAVTGAPVTALGAVGNFSTPLTVRGSAGGDFGDISVNAAGQVMVTYQRDLGPYRSAIYTNFNPVGLGGTFNRAIFVGYTGVSSFDYIPAQFTRGIDAETGLAFDNSNDAYDGRVYLVYTDEVPAASADTNIFIRYSDNNGLTWSSPTRVNDDPGTNSKFLPRISLDQTTGQVGVSWYDTRNDLGPGTAGDVDDISNTDPEFYAAVIMPQPDGLDVSVNQQIAAAPSDAYDANSSIDFGDYTGLSFDAGVLHPLWFDNSNSTGNNPNGTLNQLNAYTASVNASSFTYQSPLFLGGVTSQSGPVAALSTTAGLNTGFIRAGNSYTITVDYSAGVDLTTLGSSNLLITGPNGFSQPAVLLRTRKLRGGVVMATYRVSKPAGTGKWTPADIGTYFINLEPGSVADTAGNALDGGVLGDFVVATGLGNGTHSGGHGTRHHPRTGDD